MDNRKAGRRRARRESSYALRVRQPQADQIAHVQGSRRRRYWKADIDDSVTSNLQASKARCTGIDQ